MMTLRQFAAKPESIPTLTSWYIADLSEARGRQELFTKQSPQKLKVWREHAIVESAVSSNRIEGVTIEQSRIATVVFGKSRVRDRSEEEIRGYRDALNLIHSKGNKLPISEETIKLLHRLCRAHEGDAGDYKAKDNDIIETSPDGRVRLRFKAVSANDTPEAMRQVIENWNACLRERWVHPLIALAALNLDFLCIHPFRDGNGRVSRLLLLLSCYHLGYEVGKFISLERLIEENKERYYETLEQGSQGWHEGKHDAWSFINFTLFILKSAYKEFEDRIGQIHSPKGAKTEMVTEAITRLSNPFRVADIQRAAPSVSLDMIRRVLKNLRAESKVECLGRGQNAHW